MFRRNFVSLLAIMLVVICSGLVTPANAINPVLSISFGANRNNVEPDFTRFLVTDSGTMINGVQIDLELMQPPRRRQLDPCLERTRPGRSDPHNSTMVFVVSSAHICAAGWNKDYIDRSGSRNTILFRDMGL